MGVHYLEYFPFLFRLPFGKLLIKAIQSEATYYLNSILTLVP